MPGQFVRPFLKWPGGKFRLVPKILQHLPEGNKLVEPFLGSGALFLNSEYDNYLLNDANPDLINVYQTLQQQGSEFINYCRSFFVKKNNQEKKYYKLREEFNAIEKSIHRAALFVYLNRHGYNGLCRYNLKGGFNVPFGKYESPYFPELEMQHFYQKSQRATFICEDFSKTLAKVSRRQIVYCDPPYVPLTKTASFTQYYAKFAEQAQRQLAELATRLMAKGATVVISNHDTKITRELYRQAKITKFTVQRFISCNYQQRKAVPEILAVFSKTASKS